jgi:DNA-binding NarL/FixJ family response regulator
VRLSLRIALCRVPDIIVVGEAQDGEEAVLVCRELQPDVVLLDLHLPRLDGVGATHALRYLSPAPQVLMLTAHYDEQLIPEAIAAGACGYLLKDGEIEELIAAIRAAHTGQSSSA